MAGKEAVDMQQHKIDFDMLTGWLGAFVTYVAFLWHWLGANHNEITALCAIIGAGFSVYGFMASASKSAKRMYDKRKRGT